MIKQKIKPSLFVAVLPFIFLIVVMLIGNIVYGAPAQLPLILGIAFTCILGHFLGYSYQEIEDSMIETNKMGLQANFIMLIVGCLIGSWIVGGVVPGMIYYGLKLFTPRIFLIILPIMCAIISVSTGSADNSWYYGNSCYGDWSRNGYSCTISCRYCCNWCFFWR